jgi:hypothetical protein
MQTFSKPVSKRLKRDLKMMDKEAEEDAELVKKFENR